jgi:hypothetical protein
MVRILRPSARDPEWNEQQPLYVPLYRAPILYQSLFLLLLSWTFVIIVFAGFYMAVNQRDPQINCGLGPSGNPIHFPGAFAFSLETCTTVGYGLPSSPNAIFENCPSLQMTIYFQMVLILCACYTVNPAEA